MTTEAARPQRIAREGPLPLSLLEEGQLLVEAGRPRAGFNARLGLGFEGDLNIDALKTALDELVRRHEVLRTTFERSMDAAGGRIVFLRQIHQPRSVQLLKLDLRSQSPATKNRHADRIATAAFEQPFDYAVEPLVRAILVRLEDAHHRLILVLPHLICDARSVMVLREELVASYVRALDSKNATTPESWQYVDFAAWQRTRVRGVVLKREAEYWLEQYGRWRDAEATLDKLKGTPFCERLDGASYVQLMTEIDADVLARLRVLSRASRVTVYAVLFACLAVTLRAFMESPRIAIWSHFANRQRPEFARTVGWFAHSRLLGIDLRDDPPFEQLAARAYATIVGALSNQEVPASLIVAIARRINSEIDVTPSPRFVSFDSISDPTAAATQQSARGVKIHPVILPGGGVQSGLTIMAKEGKDHLELVWECPVHVATREAIERVSRGFQSVLGASVRDASRRVLDLASAA